MASESDRIARAGDYVFGLMDERERARAERDLQIDPAFRSAVLRVAERLHALEPTGPSSATSEDRWKLVQRRIGELPQMRLAGLNEARADPPPVIIHRLHRKPYGTGLHALDGASGLRHRARAVRRLRARLSRRHLIEIRATSSIGSTWRHCFK